AGLLGRGRRGGAFLLLRLDRLETLAPSDNDRDASMRDLTAENRDVALGRGPRSVDRRDVGRVHADAFDDLLEPGRGEDRRLASRHRYDRVVQDDYGDRRVARHGVDQRRDAGMEEGGVA